MVTIHPLAPAAPPSRVLSAPIRLITVPLWLGAERPGVELGAQAIEAGLRARWQRAQRQELLHRLHPTTPVEVNTPEDALQRLNRKQLEFLPEVAAACEQVAAAVATAVASGEVAVTLGGDHALAVGSLAGAARAARQVGVLWLDSHADLNTPATSPTGHIHGMPLAAATGHGPDALVHAGGPGPHVDPSDVCLLGTRDLDPGERMLIERYGIWMLTMEEWTDRGLLEGLELALTYLSARKVDAVHLSFDLDVLDPIVLPGTGTPVPGGLTYREASQILRRLREWDGPLISVDWVELNPSLDPSGRSTGVAVGLLATLLGETQR
ncbi:MAG: arginase [Thermomicrobiales bacterium]|nr:MAG: arginase [Thermomicrobiales bacterium]